MIAGFLGEKGGIFQGKICQTQPPTPDPELFAKNPLHKKAKTDRTLKKPQNDRESLQKKTPEKKRTASSPLGHKKQSPENGVRGEFSARPAASRSVSGILRATLGIQLGIPLVSAFVTKPQHKLSSTDAGQKNKPAAGKTCSVKRACVGAQKTPPSQTKRPWTLGVRGSLAPLATKYADQIPKRGRP